MSQNNQDQREPTQQEVEFAQFIARNFRVLSGWSIQTPSDLARVEECARKYDDEALRAFNSEVEEFLEELEAEEAEGVKKLEVKNADRASDAEQEDLEARIRAEGEAKVLEEEEARRRCEVLIASSKESSRQTGRRA